MLLFKAIRGREPRIALHCFVKTAQQQHPAEPKKRRRVSSKGRVRQTRRRRPFQTELLRLGSNGPKTVRFQVGADVGDRIHRN